MECVRSAALRRGAGGTCSGRPFTRPGSRPRTRRTSVQQRRIGTNGLVVSAIGLGCMGMSEFYGPTDEAQSLATLQAALDSGVTLLDTADMYGKGHNERLVGRAIA